MELGVLSSMESNFSNLDALFQPTAQPQETRSIGLSATYDDGIDYYPSSSSNPYEDEYVVHTIVLAWTVVILATGVVGNVLVIAAVWLHRSLRNVGNVFVVNLAVTDMGVSLVVNGFGVVGIATDARFFKGKDWLCEIIGTVCITCCVCSMWTIAAIGVNRYVSICHWPRYHRIYNRKSVIVMVIGIWILSFLIDLPNITGWGSHTFDWKTMLCTGDMAFRSSYTFFFSFFAFGAPLLVIIYSYVRIYIFAYRSKRSLKQAAAGCTASNRSSDLRLARSVLVIIVIFVAMWAPYALSVLIDYRDPVGRNTYIFTILLAHTNSSVNCFLYAATNRNFRQGYGYFFALLFCRNLRAPRMLVKKSISISQGTLHSLYQAENRL